MRNSISPHRSTRGRVLAVVTAATLLATACGGSDSDSSDTPDVTTQATQAADDAPAEPTAEASTGDDATESPIGIGEDGDIEFSDEVNDALDSVGLEQMMSIVADQLDPKPAVSIDGNNVTFTFSEGEVDSNAWLPCGTGGSFLDEGQTLTVVYPDGQQEC